MTSTPLAARTSRAVVKAGSERAWVSWARKSGPVMRLAAAVLDDGLGDGGDVVVVEGGVEGGAAMAGGAEGDALGGVGGVGMEIVVGGDEAGDVDEGVGRGELAGGVGHFEGRLWRASFDSVSVMDTRGWTGDQWAETVELLRRF